MNNLLKKILIGTAFVAPLFLMSYTAEDSDKATIYEPAPNIHLKVGDKEVSLRDYAGKTIVLQFWSKSNPKSRIANHQNDVLTSTIDVTYISICTDMYDESLSREIVEEDGNRAGNQFYRSQVKSSSELDPYLQSGIGTWVISPEGIITSQSLA